MQSMSAQCARHWRISRLEIPIAIVLISIAALRPAVAQTPDNVQYLPRDGAAIVVWTAPAGSVTGYNVYQQVITDPKSQPAAPVKVNTDPVTATSLLVENLKNGTAYHFTVTAIVDYNESAPAGPFSATDSDHDDREEGKLVAVVPQKPVQLGGSGEFYGVTSAPTSPARMRWTRRGRSR
jgi:Fibronectin type III domain